MEKQRFALLKAKVYDQLGEVRKAFQKMHEMADAFELSIERQESLAYRIHNLYSACEELMRLVADSFENRIEDAEKWHAGLLRRMRMEIAGVRPALFSERSYLLLDDLRQFRHVFRHAYSRGLEVRRLKEVLETARELEGIYEADVTRFLKRLARPRRRPRTARNRKLKV